MGRIDSLALFTEGLNMQEMPLQCQPTWTRTMTFNWLLSTSIR